MFSQILPLAIGTWQIVLIAILIVLLFGARKIPELMRGMGRGLKEFKEGMNETSSPDKSERSTESVASEEEIVAVQTRSSKPAQTKAKAPAKAQAKAKSAAKPKVSAKSQSTSTAKAPAKAQESKTTAKPKAAGKANTTAKAKSPAKPKASAKTKAE